MAPFPILRMSVLISSLMSTWIVESSLSSYAGFMVLRLGLVDDQDQVGYSAGLLIAALMIGRIVTTYFWGVVADRYGRRPVVFVSLWTTAAFAVAFGYSTTFVWALAFRFLLGMFNGLAALWSTLVAEICGKEHDVVGTAVVTTAWSLGVFGGSGLGGMLAEPAIHFPSVFSASGVFGRFPYLLPNLMGATWALLSLPLVLFFLPETLPKGNIDKPEVGLVASMRKRWWTPLGPHSPRPTAETDVPAAAETEDPGERLLERTRLLAEPRVLYLLVLYGLHMFLTQIENIFSLWALSTVAKGGLDWSTKQIGQVFLYCGGLVFFFELVVMRVLLGRFGIKTPVRAAMVILAPVSAVLPSLSCLQGKDESSLVLAAVAVLFAIFSCLDLCITGFFLAINNTTLPERRGELNGLASTVSSVTGMIGSVVWSAVFTYSIEGTGSFPFDFHLTFYFLAALRLVVAFLGWDMMSKVEGDEANDLEDSERRRMGDEQYLELTE